MTVYPDRLSPAQDDVYEALMQAHHGLGEAESHALNARLVLLLANRIGDAEELREIFRTAREYSSDE